MLKRVLTGSLLGAALFVMGGTTQAQAQKPALKPEPTQTAPAAETAIDVTTAEVQQFTNAVQQMTQVQDAARHRAVQAVQEEGLTLARYNEIFLSQQNASTPSASDVTPQEKQSFDRALSKVAEIRQSTQQQLEQVIQSNGLNVQRFSQIFAAVRQNPELRQQVQQVLQN